MLKRLLFALACFGLTAPVLAGPFEAMSGDIFLLGEVHDNPTHHVAQANALLEIAPKAVVFEMLTEARAELVTPALLADPEALAEALAWEESGWPDFTIYAPVFAAVGTAEVYGAQIPRDDTRLAMEIGILRSFGEEDAVLYGLSEPLEGEELAARLNFQMDAHCGALPTELLPTMVDLQRLRDAALARAAVRAAAETGGPVAVITGNGHARADWGVARYIAMAAPDLSVVTLGQGEDGNAPAGVFDLVLDAPSVERTDPCAAFGQPGE